MRAKVKPRSVTIYNYYRNDNVKIQTYTPTGTNDPAGTVGSICTDDQDLYVKQPSGWGRVELNQSHFL